MIRNRRVALNGIWLDELDSRIVISDIEPADGKETISDTDLAAGYGARITMKRRRTLDVVVRFKMLEHGRNVTGLQERSRLLETINAWAANGGALEVNYKPNRRLNVTLVQAPGEGSLWDYTKEFQITFRAYAIPYWETVSANSVQIGGVSSGGTGSIMIDGSAQPQCDVMIENKSGANIDSCSVTIGPHTMNFSSLGLGGNEVLVIDHMDGILRIRIRNSAGEYRSALAKRSGADDFMPQPGNASCAFTAGRACQMTVSWRARFI